MAFYQLLDLNSGSKIQAFLHSLSPELSSLTRKDIVLVMESAAMSRSFLKFLLGPLKHRHTHSNRCKMWLLLPTILWTPYPRPNASVCNCDTLSEGLLNVPSHAHEWVLRCVSRGCDSRVRVDWCGDRPADGVAGGGAWRAGTLSLQHIKAILVLSSDTGFFFLKKENHWHNCTGFLKVLTS